MVFPFRLISKSKKTFISTGFLYCPFQLTPIVQVFLKALPGGIIVSVIDVIRQPDPNNIVDITFKVEQLMLILLQK